MANPGSYTVGVDLGGTNIKTVVVSNGGELLEYTTSDTADAEGSWAYTIKDNLERIQHERKTTPGQIGIAAPGLAASDGRSIAHMQGRLNGLEGLVWTSFLETPAPVFVLNDAHAALLGELWQGAAKGYRNVILLTLGTGVGGAVLADGRLIKGRIGRAGHLGHVTVNSEGALDIVNTPGSLEQMIGNYNLRERSNGRFDSTRRLVEAHLGGDKEASDVWLQSIFHLGAAIASFINAFDPEIVIVGGGIAKAGAALFDPLANCLDKFEWRPMGHRVPVISAELGDKAGAIGAAYHALLQDKS
jgi:glucokinase